MWIKEGKGEDDLGISGEPWNKTTWKTSCGVLKPLGNNKKSRNPGVHSWNAWQWGGNKHTGGWRESCNGNREEFWEIARQLQKASQEGDAAGLSETKTDSGVVRKSQGKIFFKSYKTWWPLLSLSTLSDISACVEGHPRMSIGLGPESRRILLGEGKSQRAWKRSQHS